MVVVIRDLFVILCNQPVLVLVTIVTTVLPDKSVCFPV